MKLLFIQCMDSLDFSIPENIHDESCYFTLIQMSMWKFAFFFAATLGKKKLS